MSRLFLKFPNAILFWNTKEDIFMTLIIFVLVQIWMDGKELQELGLE